MGKKDSIEYLSKAFFISLFGPILGNPMVLVVMLALAMMESAGWYERLNRRRHTAWVAERSGQKQQSIPTCCFLKVPRLTFWERQTRSRASSAKSGGGLTSCVQGRVLIKDES